jgi:dolichyl-diphosphooligosaccharide--protein glycosyltransferase
MAPKNKAAKPQQATAPLPADPAPIKRAVEAVEEVEERVLQTAPSPKAVPQTKQKQRLAYPVPDYISPATINNTQSLLRFVILGLISAAAIGSRLFAVIRFESVIHEL